MFVVASLFLLFFLTRVAAPQPLDDTTGTLERLATFIDQGTSYLDRICHLPSQDPNHVGKFTYEASLAEELPIDFVNEDQEDYNLLRHNGAIYSLGLSYQRSPNNEVLQAMQRAVDFLKKEAIAPVPEPSAQMTDDDNVYEKRPHIPNLLAAWETNGITGGNTGNPTAKLGGAGLALIALVSLEQTLPGSTEIEYMRQLGEFIRFLQQEDGSFYCRYLPHKGGKDDTWVSLYYPGEAALGLLYLASIDDNEETRNNWIESAKKTLLYLEDLRRTQELEDVEPDHWALLATAKLLPLLDERSNDYWLVYQHGVKVVQSMLSVQTREELEENDGCHTSDGRTCPTATRLEGLLAAMTFVRDDELFVVDWLPKVERLRDRMLFFIQLGINFLLDAQETDTTYNMHGGVPARFPPESEDDKDVRVDYVQHSMSAMIAYETYLQSGGEKKTRASSKVRQMIANNKHLRIDSAEGDSTLLTIGFLLVIVLVGIAAFSMVRKPKKTRVL
jgi:hypothetical protein